MSVLATAAEAEVVVELEELNGSRRSISEVGISARKADRGYPSPGLALVVSHLWPYIFIIVVTPISAL